MLLLDEPDQMLVAAAQAGMTPAADSAKIIAEGSAAEALVKHDSIVHTVADSLRNMNIGDFKDVVTGQNTIIRDAISSLVDLTVAFVPTYRSKGSSPAYCSSATSVIPITLTPKITATGAVNCPNREIDR